MPCSCQSAHPPFSRDVQLTVEPVWALWGFIARLDAGLHSGSCVWHGRCSSCVRCTYGCACRCVHLKASCSIMLTANGHVCCRALIGIAQMNMLVAALRGIAQMNMFVAALVHIRDGHVCCSTCVHCVGGHVGSKLLSIAPMDVLNSMCS